MAHSYSQDDRKLPQVRCSVTRALDFVVLVVLVGCLGWAQEKIGVRSDFSHVTLACDDGSIQALKVISRGHSSSILNAS